MKPYPEYKNSGLEWLGEIPAHWEVKKLKFEVAQVVEPTNKQDESEIYVALEHVQGLTGRYIQPKEKVDFDSNVKKFQFGDVLFGRLRPYLAKVLFAPQNGVCVGEFLVLRVRREEKLCSRYLHFRLLCVNSIALINSSTFGAQMPRASWDFIGNCKFSFPPLSEQRAIVSFIEVKQREISAYIAGKTRVLGHLKELKVAVIARAVTRGLNPHVKTRDSGVEWLGDVPAHWEMKKLKFVTSKVGSGVTPKGGAHVYQSFGIPILRSQNVHFNELRLEQVAFISEETHQEMSGSVVKPGDVLLNITGASLGRCCYVPENLIIANVNQHVCIIRPTKRISSPYLAYLLASDYIQRNIWGDQNGASREALTFGQIKDFPLIVPPLPEQAEIVAFIEKEVAEIDLALSQTGQEIVLARELLQSLIAEAVTGQIDVRHRAHRELSSELLGILGEIEENAAAFSDPDPDPDPESLETPDEISGENE